MNTLNATIECLEGGYSAYIENIDADVMTVASHISAINGESVSIYEAYTYFARGKGSALDYAKLVSHLKKFAFGARPYATFKCSCGEYAEAEVPLTSDFFLPELSFVLDTTGTFNGSMAQVPSGNFL